MTTRTKFIVTSINHYVGGREIKMGAVTTGEHDKSFWKWTPAGSITVQLSDDAPALGMFEVGKEYHVDFSKIEITSNGSDVQAGV